MVEDFHRLSSLARHHILLPRIKTTIGRKKSLEQGCQSFLGPNIPKRDNYTIKSKNCAANYSKWL
jgi:hypothetical protein